MRALLRVFERNVFDAVRAENDQLADVLLVLLLIPAIVRIRSSAIPELMAADGKSRRCRHVQRTCQSRNSWRPLNRPQQSSYAEQRSAPIGSDDPHRVASLHAHALTSGPSPRT